jgi:hypothetical protein
MNLNLITTMMSLTVMLTGAATGMASQETVDRNCRVCTEV